MKTAPPWNPPGKLLAAKLWAWPCPGWMSVGLRRLTARPPVASVWPHSKGRLETRLTRELGGHPPPAEIFKAWPARRANRPEGEGCPPKVLN